MKSKIKSSFSNRYIGKKVLLRRIFCSLCSAKHTASKKNLYQQCCIGFKVTLL